ncbi:fructose-6-phosphate aldolase [Candidatus Woesearchaeota archaeon]|nr:fructose-6-phosphate aldolase [Candidatus Woesearchaeota archaeon]
MKLFIDTANIADIRRLNELGIVDGVTTNPSWISRDSKGRSFKEIVQEICREVKGPVSAEVTSTDTAGMLKEARDISTWAKNTVIKLPTTAEGLKALKTLSGEGIKTNMTLVFSANQALLAGKLEATFVSPFIGRLYDAGYDGMQLIKDCTAIYRNYGFKTKILAASFREPREITEAALAGADIATVKPELVEQMIKNPFTDAGLKSFLDSWAAMKKQK